MNNIDYKKKYNDMSYWVAKVIGQTNELYKTLSEQIVILIEENDQLRKTLESKGNVEGDEVGRIIDEIESNEIKKKNKEMNVKVDSNESGDRESDELEEIVDEAIKKRNKERGYCKMDTKEEKPNEEKQNE